MARLIIGSLFKLLFGLCLLVFLVATSLPISQTEAQVKVINVEMWGLIPGSCEYEIFNDDYQSGLRRCYYLDPKQRYGVGAITEIFYRDGSARLFWKGWMLSTNKAQTAYLLDNGQWYVSPPSKMAYGMSNLTAMREFFVNAKNAATGSKLTLKKNTWYVVDKNGKQIMDKITTNYFNKNSAKDPDPK